jgi:alpha-ketoglutarate-dependent taurine dioxygenase
MTITEISETPRLRSADVGASAPFRTVEPGAAAGLDVRPLAATIGAEIEGVDLSAPLDPAVRDGILGALRQWRVVFFRGQRLDHGAQIALARQFGELTYAHPHDDHPPQGYPQIYTVDPKRFTPDLSDEQRREIRRRYSYTSGWHTDVTPAVNPPAASILRAETVPPFGGDTTFANLVAAYDNLSEPLRQLADTLVAEHYYGANTAPQGRPANQLYGALQNRIHDKRLIAHHPVVRVIPETGEKALFVNPVFTGRIVNVNPDESRRLLELFFAQIQRPAHHVRFRWDAGSVAFWDNRTTSHLGPQDLDDVDVDRVLHRVTLIGEVPVGPDGRESVLIEGTPFRSAPVFAPDEAA